MALVYWIICEISKLICLNKYYNLKDFKKKWETEEMDPDYFMISTGIGEADFERLVAILTHIDCNWICIGTKFKKNSL